MSQDPAPLDTLDEKKCSSPMAHNEHLFVVHNEGDVEDSHYRCPGSEVDE